MSASALELVAAVGVVVNGLLAQVLAYLASAKAASVHAAAVSGTVLSGPAQVPTAVDP